MHSLEEIFNRADEMDHHPLNWPWNHWFIQSSLLQQSLMLLYRTNQMRQLTYRNKCYIEKEHWDKFQKFTQESLSKDVDWVHDREEYELLRVHNTGPVRLVPRY